MAAAYRSDVDGLRAVAVLAVVLHHLAETLLPGGYVGVDVFFVISGYLITGIISREMEQGRFSFRRFYERRARRIFPALFVVLAVTLVAGYRAFLPSDYAFMLRAALGTVFFSSNMVFWRVEKGYFDADTRSNPLLHTWSLGVEEQFYLLFPLFLLACYRVARTRVAWTLVICAAVSLACAAVLVRTNRAAAFYLSPFRAWELLAGALLAIGFIPPARSALVREIMVAGGLAAIIATSFLYDEHTAFPGLAALVPVLGAVAVIHAGSSGASIASRLLTWRPMVYVGLISYSLYLWHWPVIVLDRYEHGSDVLRAPLLFALSLLLASVSYRFIEQPIRRGPRRMLTWAIPSAAGFVATVTVVCAVGLAAGGFPARFSPAVVRLDQARLAPLPYIGCVDQHSPSCILGAAGREPDTLLWGDSHLLAWTPALDHALARARRSAVLASTTGCAPLFEVENTVKPSCAPASAAVKGYLAQHPHIRTVILAGLWSWYFSERGPLTLAVPGGPTYQGLLAAQRGLQATEQWLRDSGRTLVVIGPVPVYASDVPRALAMQALTGRRTLDQSTARQREKDAPFEAAVRGLPANASFQYLDPLPWLCSNECAVETGGVSLYRDSNHLSVPGAMALESRLRAHLALDSRPTGNVTAARRGPDPTAR